MSMRTALQSNELDSSCDGCYWFQQVPVHVTAAKNKATPLPHTPHTLHTRTAPPWTPHVGVGDVDASQEATVLPHRPQRRVTDL